uniref:DapH/DapD/GlmU-related protein n=3 Tax=Oscillospiraceae TaxID=216572 RepID=UPI003AB17DE5
TKYGFGPDDDSVVAWRREQRVVIGNDVWLGHNAVIMGGVTIGDGAVVGAGAVVTHDVAPYDVVAGVPARRLRRRFDGETAAALGRIRWWDWPHELLRERIADFRTIEGFCEKYDPLRAGSK